MDDPVDKSNLDVSQIFLVFMATVGDVTKTANALDMDPDIVDRLARQEGWLDKIRRISVMSKSEKPGDFERATNRALNYVQAHLFRLSMDRMLKYVRGLENDAIGDISKTTDRSGVVRISGRFWADMAAAMEKCHAMTYAALGDTATERKDQLGNGDKGGVQPADIHASVIAALNASSMEEKEKEALLLSNVEEVIRDVTSAPVEPK